MVLTIISFCIGLVVYLAGGFVCGRICVDIIRDKNSRMNEVMWFWAGFLFNVVAIFATFAVKNRND